MLYVTGFSGFVGRNAGSYFAADPDITCEALDLRKPLATDQWLPGSAILHLAGKAHDLRRVQEPDSYYRINYELTRKLYDAFLLSEATCFIFMSSVKAAADRVEGVLMEEMPATPQTDYGKSKLMAEEYIQSRPLPAGKQYIILRPCMIHGPGNKGNLTLLYQLLQKGIPWPLGAFQNQRSFLGISNLCFVIDALLRNSQVPSGIYQVADDSPLSTNQLVSLIASVMGKTAVIWKVPVKWVKMLAKAGDILHLPLTTEKLQKLTESYVVSNHKIVTALGKQLPLSSEEGIRQTIGSFVKQP